MVGSLGYPTTENEDSKGKIESVEGQACMWYCMCMCGCERFKSTDFDSYFQIAYCRVSNGVAL